MCVYVYILKIVLPYPCTISIFPSVLRVPASCAAIRILSAALAMGGTVMCLCDDCDEDPDLCGKDYHDCEREAEESAAEDRFEAMRDARD